MVAKTGPTAITLVILAIVAHAQVPPTFPETVDILRHHLKMGEKNLHFMSPFMNYAATGRRLDNIWDAIAVSPRLYNVSEKCFNGTNRVLDALVRLEPWAMKVVDATGKLESGVLQGNTHWWGSFTECQGIVELLPIYNSTSPSSQVQNVFQALPCTAVISNASIELSPANTLLEMMSGIELGVCVPSVCSSEDVSHLVNNLLFMFPEDYQVTKVTCRPPGPLPYDTPAIAMICVLSLLGAVIIAATMYDLLIVQGGWARIGPPADLETLPTNDDETSPLLRARDYMPLGNSPKDHGKPGQKSTLFAALLMSFSVYTNGAKLLSTAKSPTNLDVVDGVRFISMTWVILGHTYFFSANYITNIADVASYLKTWHFQAIINALVSVDTFFLLSGLLLSYLLLKELEARGGPLKINWLKFYFHRFWRLTPPYMLILGAEAALFKYWATGPMWPSETGIEKTCHKDWWANLLYVNNLVHGHMGCFGWSWYLANDMQFFIVSPLFVIPFYLNWIAGLVVTLITLLISTIVIAVITIQKHYGAEIISLFAANNVADAEAFFNDIYITPWCRIGPYLVGIMYGYLIFKTRRQIKIHWALALLGWLIAAVSALAVLYGLYGEVNGHPLSESVGALYSSMHRTVWAAAVGWVIFACVTGYGGWVDDFLSWRPFIPLSRLTYMAYLVHPIVMMFGYASLKRALFIDTIVVVNRFLGHLVLSFGVAFIMSLSLESPVIGLEKVLLRR